MFATDRDLLVLEPGLVGQVGWVGQRLVSGTGDVSGTALALSSSDQGLVTQGVGAGHVVAIGGVGYEVVSVSAEDAAVVSRVRASADDDPVAITAKGAHERCQRDDSGTGKQLCHVANPPNVLFTINRFESKSKPLGERITVLIFQPFGTGA